jgi:ATP-dependent DNA helicase RecQ
VDLSEGSQLSGESRTHLGSVPTVLGVRYVIHYDVPGDLVAYAQEAGRAGRNLPPGEEAWCILLYYPGDSWIHYRFAEDKFPDEALLATIVKDVHATAKRRVTAIPWCHNT